MSLNREKLGIPAAALIAALGGCGEEKPKEPPPQPLIEVQMEIAKRLDNIARVDMLDGKDDLFENALSANNRDFLNKLDAEDPQKKRNLLLRLRRILREKKPSQTQEEAEKELEILDLVDLQKMLNLRDAIVSPEGEVRFPTVELEVSTTLADLTMDDNVLFVAGEKTQSKMQIKASPAPFKAFKLKQPAKVKVGDKEILAQPGTFVTEVDVEIPPQPPSQPQTPPRKSTVLYKVYVHSGDKIIDSLSGDFNLHLTTSQTEENLDVSKDFEQFLRIKIPKIPAETGRQIFHYYFPTYDRIFDEEYKELFTPYGGIKRDKHFVYFIEWAYLNKLPINEDSIRAFLDKLAERKIATQTDYENAEEKILNNASKALKGEKDQDEDMLSYHDQRVKSESDHADILRKKHGPLFAVVRLQGRFFDNYTYNRLTGNYSAKVGATVVNGQEYLAVYDLAEGSGSGEIPRDIREKIHPSSFAEKINTATTYNALTDTALKEALAFSESAIGASASPQDFNVEYNTNGTINAVTFKGAPYNPSTFIAPPDSLKQLPENKASFVVGGIQITMDLQHYFDRYHELEARNRGKSQQIILYDKTEKNLSRVRNPSWFIEEGGAFYKQVAEQVTAGIAQPHEKLLAIGRWLQTNLSYIEEMSEINKITLATFMDHGGDCEDSYTTFKTLANALGLGDYVGGVMFQRHIAAMVKGSHGKTTYTVNGEAWTIFETATNGKTLQAGETSRKNPLVFILPNGEVVSAGGNVIPLNIVPLSEIDGKLVEHFNQTVGNLGKFTADPEKQPSEKTLDKGDNLLEEGNALFEAMMTAYTDISASGKTADVLTDQLDSAAKKYQEFLRKWEEFMSKQISDERKLELKDAPEQIKESLQRFKEKNAHFEQNALQTVKEVQELLKAYRGRENDKNAMLELQHAMKEVIDGSEVILDIGNMKIEYKETLKHAAPQIADTTKKILEAHMDFANKYILHPWNMIVEIVEAHRGQ